MPYRPGTPAAYPVHAPFFASENERTCTRSPRIGSALLGGANQVRRAVTPNSSPVVGGYSPSLSSHSANLFACYDPQSLTSVHASKYSNASGLGLGLSAAENRPAYRRHVPFSIKDMPTPEENQFSFNVTSEGESCGLGFDLIEAAGGKSISMDRVGSDLSFASASDSSELTIRPMGTGRAVGWASTSTVNTPLDSPAFLRPPMARRATPHPGKGVRT